MFLIYGLASCPYCKNSEELLRKIKDKYNIPYKKYNMRSKEEKEYFKYMNKMNTFPQIFLMKKDKIQKIGGNDELIKFIKKNNL